MATEEQLVGIPGFVVGRGSGEIDKAGQVLTVVNRTITHLSFRLSEYLDAWSGDITYEARLWSDKSLLASVVAYNGNQLTGTPTLIEKELSTPLPIVNSGIFIGVAAFTGNTRKGVKVDYNYSPDLKASERVGLSYRGISFGYASPDTMDLVYIYTYLAGVGLPTVTTQAVSDILSTTATGNGNITNLGDGTVSQHGVCWNTGGTPTTADNKTEEGAAGTGAFTTNMTGLLPNTLYYVRAYATSEYGTSYGSEVSFTTATAFIPKVLIF